MANLNEMSASAVLTQAMRVRSYARNVRSKASCTRGSDCAPSSLSIPPFVIIRSEFCWLTCGSKDRTPPAAGRVEALRMRCEQLDWHVNKTFMYKTDNNASLASHGCVNSVSRKQIA